MTADWPVATPATLGLPRGWLGWVLLNLGIFAIYSVAGLVVFYVGIGAADISPIFPPSGIAVASVLIFGPRIWPALWFGNFCNGAPLLFSAETSLAAAIIGNGAGGIAAVAEALGAAKLMRWLSGNWQPFDRALDTVVFLLVAGPGGAACGAVIGVGTFWLVGVTPSDQFPITFVTWLLADVAGIGVFAPLVLAWYRDGPGFDGRLIGTAAAVIAAVAVVGALAYVTKYPIDYLYLPILLWAGFRAKARGASFAATAISAAIIVATANGVGSFIGKSDNQSFLLVEGFMAVITFTGLLVVAVRAQQEAAELALEAHNRTLEQRVVERTAEIAEKNRLLEEKDQRINDDLVVARTLQAAILPTDFDSFAPTDVAAAMRPAYEMAGDFYDVFRIGERKLALIVGDVSGKGIAAAFFMAVTRTTLHDIALLRDIAPADCVASVNETLCNENMLDMFVTLFYAEFDEATGDVVYVNAGHCEPVIAGPGGARLLRRTGDPALGVVPKRRFTAKRLILAPGETLFLYTDGVTEAFDPAGNLYDVKRLLAVAETEAGKSPRELMQAVIDSVDAFAGGALQSDDITCLAVRREPAAALSLSSLPWGATERHR
jgi:serine phosphatase RsbU (regulator of sigma subunit)